MLHARYVGGKELQMKIAALVSGYVLCGCHGCSSLLQSVGLNDWSLAKTHIQVHRGRQDLCVQGNHVLQGSKIGGSIILSHVHVSLSIFWLCVELPVIILFCLSPRCWSMCLATSTFSPPKSLRTLDGSPYFPTPRMKAFSTVAASLLVLHSIGTIIRPYPFIPAWVTKRHLINLW